MCASRLRSCFSLPTIVLISFLALQLMPARWTAAQDANRPPRPPQADNQDDAATSDDSVDEVETIETRTADMTLLDGFMPMYWDESTAKLWLRIDEFDQDFLYVTGLAAGLGSNPVGLDRGQLGDSRVVRFRRVGPRVYLEQPNLRYRASSDLEAERNAVADSFASSIIWSAEVDVESDGSVLVDSSSLVLRDAHQVTRTLSRSNQGSFSLDLNRSHVHLPRTKGFPDNSEVEVVLTFAGSSPGPHVRETAASASDVTLRQHHSFVRLPDNEYQPRRFDPRIGGFSIRYSDYSAPLDQPIEQRLITRHRLVKQDPTAAVSEAVEPIVYYVDSGVPQPVRDALIEGARWWNAAFESAGFRDAFQVQELPPEADPMDVRYNVIQWVHRSTRGWSYGQSVIDPRTGEIIKGHVLLGSLRVRQDRMIVEGLDGIATINHQPISVAQEVCSCCRLDGYSDSLIDLLVDDDLAPTDVALARIRQLSAHEVGHTIGFAHNFAASTYDDRASVMDYPAPRIGISEDRTLDFADAYGVGVGTWDHVTVVYAYSQFAPGSDESAELDRIINEAEANGHVYLTDADARPSAAADPRANLWDNGDDPVVELKHLLEVRQTALESFGQDRIATGRAQSELEQVLVPIYLLHRYQVEAVAKMIGGVEYGYRVTGDGLPAFAVVSQERQSSALDALMITLSADQLTLSESIVNQIPPKPFSSLRDIERFSGRSAMIFDPLAAAESASDWTLQCLLQPERMNRLIHQQGLSIDDVMHGIQQTVWAPDAPADPRQASVYRAIQNVTLRRTIQLASDTRANPDVVAVCRARLTSLSKALVAKVLTEQDELHRAHLQWTIERINRFLDDGTTEFSFPRPTELPPGSPIGSD